MTMNEVMELLEGLGNDIEAVAFDGADPTGKHLRTV